MELNSGTGRLEDLAMILLILSIIRWMVAIFLQFDAFVWTGGDAWLLKIDTNGNEQWNKTFGLDGFDNVYSVVQTSDGGYVLAGTFDTAKNPDFKGQILYENYDAWLFKTDAKGNLEWSKTIGGLKRDEARLFSRHLMTDM